MAKVYIDKLILSLEKWKNVCEALNIKEEKDLIEDTISVLKGSKEITLELKQFSKENKTSSTATKPKSKAITKKSKTDTSFLTILDDYKAGIDMKKKYKFKLVNHNEDIKTLWEKADTNLKQSISIKELTVIFCILTNSDKELKKKVKQDYIASINNVVSNINRDKALDNIVV